MPFTYATEDGPLLLTMLEEGRYDVVVGNPPYITVKDKALNRIYRSKYADVCKGTYALTVPFMALFFALAKSGERQAGSGQITSNSFMKREFGIEADRGLPARRTCASSWTLGRIHPWPLARHGHYRRPQPDARSAPPSARCSVVRGEPGDPIIRPRACLDIDRRAHR